MGRLDRGIDVLGCGGIVGRGGLDLDSGYRACKTRFEYEMGDETRRCCCW